MSIMILVAGGMDFRAMLMRKKKPAKKVVVVSTCYLMINSNSFKWLKDKVLFS